MKAVAKLHTYYINNASTKMNYAHLNITETELYKALNESFNDITEFSDDEFKEQENKINLFEEENSNLIEDSIETLEISNEMVIENYFNYSNEEL